MIVITLGYYRSFYFLFLKYLFVLSLKPRCISSIDVKHFLSFVQTNVLIDLFEYLVSVAHIYICVCVCVCVRVRALMFSGKRLV